MLNTTGWEKLNSFTRLMDPALAHEVCHCAILAKLLSLSEPLLICNCNSLSGSHEVSGTLPDTKHFISVLFSVG